MDDRPPLSATSSGEGFFRRHRLELLVFFGSLAIFAAVSADRMLRQSQAPHFVYLADAFLHGRLDNRLPPPNDNDWIRYEGKTYVSFPPVPAVLMMPFVAVFGVGFNDVLFTLPFAALNVLLMFLVLQMLSREGLSRLAKNDNLWLAAFFGFGTVHFCAAVIGEVWFTAQIVALTFTLLYILCATRARRPFWAGVWLALAFDTRVNMAFSVGYFALQLFFPRRADGGFAAGDWKAVLKKGALFAIPCLVVGGLQMAMNHARFHDVFEFGHRFLSGPAGNRIREHGLYAYHYLEWNLKALLIKLPVFSAKPPFVGYDPDGMSIFITSPLVVRLFWPREKNWLYPILWAALIPSILPALFYQNSGYVQFGYRFALDVMPYIVMLLSVGRVPVNRTTKVLIIIGIIINLAGAIAFKRTGPI